MEIPRILAGGRERGGNREGRKRGDTEEHKETDHKDALPVGIEPATLRLTAICSNLLKHGDCDRALIFKRQWMKHEFK